MDKNKQVYLTLIILGYCLLMIGVFVYFSRKETPQVKKKETTSVSSSKNIITTPTTGPTVTVIFAPTPIIEKMEDPENKDWTIYTNKKYNYSISLPKTFIINISNVKNVRLSKSENKTMYPVNYVNIYSSTNDTTAEKMDLAYRYLGVGQSTDYGKTKVMITRLPPITLKSGTSMRVFENKNMSTFVKGTRNIFFTYGNDKTFVAINAYIEGKDFTTAQLNDTEFTKSVLNNYISETELNEIISTFKLLN